MFDRRAFLRASLAVACAPMIVRASSLMKVRQRVVADKFYFEDRGAGVIRVWQVAGDFVPRVGWEECLMANHPPYFPHVADSGEIGLVNFGETAFAQQPPSGFIAWE